QPKIADFGLSKQINEKSMTSNSIINGMPAYIEPRCFIDHRYRRDKKSDIYSLGVILWEISSGKPPFQNFESLMALCFHVYQGNREDHIEGTPPQYIELYENCWDNDPDNRPEAKLIFDVLNQLIPDKNFVRHHPIEILTQNSEAFSNYQNNTKELVNSLEIISSPLYLLDSKNSNILAQDNDILENLRNEAYECFKQGEFLKALTLYEEILESRQHSAEDQKLASTWDLSYNQCGLKKLKELTKVLCKNTTLTSLNLEHNKLGPKGEKH
ncbi:kinase-like domain-containing protein, partial [Gigaspora rosea]